MKKNYAVLFDLDGTLLNTDNVIFESYKHTFAKLRPGYELSELEMLSFLGPAIRDNMSRFFTREELEESIEIYRTFCDDNHDKMVFAYDTVKETLEQLHENGYPIGVVTTKAVTPATDALKHNGLWDYIDTLIGYESVPSSKPNPEGVNKALSLLGCDKGVMIGDNDVDVLAGKGAGLHTISVKWSLKGYRHLEELNPDLLVDKMIEILNGIESLNK